MPQAVTHRDSAKKQPAPQMARGPVGGSCSCHMQMGGGTLGARAEGGVDQGLSSRAADEGDETLLGGGSRGEFTEQWLPRKQHMHTQVSMDAHLCTCILFLFDKRKLTPKDVCHMVSFSETSGRHYR